MSHPGGADWKQERLKQVLAFARGSRLEQGFGWLNDDGTVDADRPLELWINARMTYVFATVGDQELAEHGIRALREVFEDPEHGGWFDVSDGSDPAKRCYGHDFVLLAGAAAAKAGVPGGAELLADAARVHTERFWDAKAGRCVEEWSQDWTRLDEYRGANSNMHAVECYLAAADATGDSEWLDRALLIAERIIGVTARAHDWRIVEHFDADWNAQPELNRDRPDDPFRPYGATPGHGFEWSRLLVELAAALDDPSPWIVEAAEHLFDRAVDDALDDDHPLLPYTTGWDGVPIVEERFHWVVAEAVQAAETLYDATQQALLGGLVERWWAEIDEHVIDPVNGSWIHELSPTLGPSTRTWRGRPDAYHAVNALAGGAS